jgi:hypothetical protein
MLFLPTSLHAISASQSLPIYQLHNFPVMWSMRHSTLYVKTWSLKVRISVLLDLQCKFATSSDSFSKSQSALVLVYSELTCIASSTINATLYALLWISTTLKLSLTLIFISFIVDLSHRGRLRINSNVVTRTVLLAVMGQHSGCSPVSSGPHPWSWAALQNGYQQDQWSWTPKLVYKDLT